MHQEINRSYSFWSYRKNGIYTAFSLMIFDTVMVADSGKTMISLPRLLLGFALAFTVFCCFFFSWDFDSLFYSFFYHPPDLRVSVLKPEKGFRSCRLLTADNSDFFFFRNLEISS